MELPTESEKIAELEQEWMCSPDYRLLEFMARADPAELAYVLNLPGLSAGPRFRTLEPALAEQSAALYGLDEIYRLWREL